MPEGLANLRERLQLARKECREIGRVPPRPAGLRSAVSGFAVAVMQRLMFWYAPAVQRTIGALTDVMDDALRDLERTIQQESTRHSQQLQEAIQRESDRASQQLLVAIQQESARITALESRLHQVHALLERQLQEAIHQLQGAIQQERVRIDEQARALELERSTTIGIESSLREQTDTLQQIEEERRQKEEELELRLRESGERLQLLRRETIENAQRLVRFLEEARRASPPAPLHAAHPHAFAQEDLAGLDALEAALESEVRGTRAEAQARWRVYLPLIPREGPVLDLGSGRGEWLELLRQEGIPARGVDSNRLMVAECRERLLDAEQAEALDYLARTPDGSMGAVTVLRLVEHLPFRQLVRLLDEVARVLRPGGTAIFETPNPDNILVASRDFYRDPGRRHPLPSETLRFLVESRGLEPVEVLFAAPESDADRLPEEGEGAAARRFNRFFYGPREYAVVSRKVPL
jgi:SAM-dependent methyltransferase